MIFAHAFSARRVIAHRYDVVGRRFRLVSSNMRTSPRGAQKSAAPPLSGVFNFNFQSVDLSAGTHLARDVIVPPYPPPYLYSVLP